jgi:dipeptidyl aminopeptidase/acylaminoacyl peptidase
MVSESGSRLGGDWTYSLSKLGIVGILAFAVPFSASAQLHDGAGFDPTNVEIPNIEKTAPRAITTMDLLRLRDIHGIQISPDGKYVAFVLGQAVYEANSYRSSLFVVGTEKGNKPISLGTAGPPRLDDINEWISEPPQWSSDGKYIYHCLKSSGTWQVWRWNREGGAPAQVTHAVHDVKSFHIASDGTKLVMTIEKPPANRKELAEHGILYDGSIDQVAPKPIVDRIVDAHGVESEIWIQDLRNGVEHKATDEEIETSVAQESDPNAKIFSKAFTKEEIEKQHVSDFQISPDRKMVTYSRYVDDFSESEWLSWPVLLKSMDGGPPVVLTHGAYYGSEQYWWAPDSKAIYYTDFDPENANDGRPSKLMVVDATGGKARQVLKSSGLLGAYSADRSGRLLACFRENNTTPPELALADLSTGEVRTLVDVNPEFQNLQLSPARRIDVTNKYGDHFWGHLVLPVGYEPGKRYPLIITTYEDYDGFLRGGVGDEYPIQVFAANGFAVLNFEAVGRLRNSRPNDFDTATLFWRSPIEGMEAALTELADMGVIDRARVGITGLSHGADLLDFGISHTDLFRAAAESGDDSRDPFQYYIGSDRDRAWFSRFLELGLPDGDSLARWQQVSPALNAHRIRTPLLINAADAESIADMQLVTNLRELKKPVEMFIYPNEQHVKNQPKHRYEIYERNVDWMKFWLKGEEDPDPAKAEQYARWRELRKLQDPKQSNAPTNGGPHSH